MYADETLQSGHIRCTERCWTKEGAGLTNLLTMLCAHWVHISTGWITGVLDNQSPDYRVMTTIILYVCMYTVRMCVCMYIFVYVLYVCVCVYAGELEL